MGIDSENDEPSPLHHPRIEALLPCSALGFADTSA